MTLHLTKEESKVFLSITSAEMHCLVDEYDPDLGGRPSKKRMQGLERLKGIAKKWEDTQPKIKETEFVNLDDVKACDMDLSDIERFYVKKLIEKAVIDTRKYLEPIPTPYKGVLLEIKEDADTADQLAKRL